MEQIVRIDRTGHQAAPEKAAVMAHHFVIIAVKALLGDTGRDRDDQPWRKHGPTRWDNRSFRETQSMRIIILIALAGILLSLGSALVDLVRDKGTTNRTVNALTLRVGISVALFLFILFSYWMGWIQPRSY